MNQATNPMNDVRTAARQFAEGRKALSRLFPDVTEAKLAALADIFTEDNIVEPAVQVSNVGRVGAGRGTASPEERPSLKQAMVTVLKDAGESLNGDMVYAELEKRSWLPSTTNPRQYIGHTLSSSKELFLRDPDMGRGFYMLAEGAKSGNGKAAKPSLAKTKGKKTTPSAKELSPESSRVVKVLQKTTEPFTLRDVAKAAKIPNHRSAHFLLLNLEKTGAVSRLRKKSEAGHVFWQIERKPFDQFVARHQAS